MATNNSFPDADDWTPEESALFRGLVSERIPPSELKARTIESVRERGLIGERLPASRRRLMVMLAAACVTFAAGAAVGYAAASRVAKPAENPRVAKQAFAQADTTLANAQPLRHIIWY